MADPVVKPVPEYVQYLRTIGQPVEFIGPEDHRLRELRLIHEVHPIKHTPREMEARALAASWHSDTEQGEGQPGEKV